MFEVDNSHWGNYQVESTNNILNYFFNLEKVFGIPIQYFPIHIQTHEKQAETSQALPNKHKEGHIMSLVVK